MELKDRILDYLHYHPSSKRAALLLFYEQNNLSAFKKIFLEQVAFAVEEYF